MPIGALILLPISILVCASIFIALVASISNVVQFKSVAEAFDTPILIPLVPSRAIIPVVSISIPLVPASISIPPSLADVFKWMAPVPDLELSISIIPLVFKSKPLVPASISIPPPVSEALM